MESKNKITTAQKQILVGLFNSDEKIVVKTILDCRNKGGEYVIEPLMEICFTHKSEIVVKEILGLFADLRDDKLNHLITDNILKYIQSERMTAFVSALWQSSIKFDNINILLEIFISGNDMTSFEALTLIQQNADMLNDKMSAECLDILKSELPNMCDFKKTLSVDLLEIFK